MKSTGIVRRVDDLGRIVIPKELRSHLSIKSGSPLEIYTDEKGKVILSKFENSCAICASTTNLVEFEDNFICPNCIKKVSKLGVGDAE